MSYCYTNRVFIAFLKVLLVLSIPLFLCLACEEYNKIEKYEQFDFDPYSETRNPYYASIGFYLDNTKFINGSHRNMYGACTRVKWNEISIEDERYIIIKSELFCPTGVSDFSISTMWVRFPFDNITTGVGYTMDCSDSAIEVYTLDNMYQGVRFSNDGIKVGASEYQLLPVKSLTVTYDTISKQTVKGVSYSMIDGSFKADVELDLVDGKLTIYLSEGVFHLIRRNDNLFQVDQGYYANYYYDAWLNDGMRYYDGDSN